MNPEQVDTVQKAAALASALNHIKANRLEYLVLSMFVYTTGIGSAFLTQAQGMCI